MSKTKAEKERRYYNKKLIKDGFKSEMKKPHKIDWKQTIISIIGVSLGFIIIDNIKTERFIHNSFGRYIVEISIIVIAIIIINILANVIYKISSKEK